MSTTQTGILMLKYILMFIACWFVLSIPLGIAIGRFFHIGEGKDQ